jgi:hypothetical protein
MPRLVLNPAPRLVLGTFLDCTMAEAWVGAKLRIFPGKYGEDPVWGYYDELKHADGADALEAFARTPEEFRTLQLPPNALPGTEGLHGAVWFESIHSADADGQTLYALYHNENYPSTLPFDPASGDGYREKDWPPGLQGDSSPQAVPRIGIMRSRDGGESWTDLGIVLEDRDERLVRSPANRNNTFPGGVGDPCAVACGDHLYIFFGAYGYPETFDPATHDPAVEASGQCISVARIPLADLDSPIGAARRWDGMEFAATPDGVGRPIAALQIPAADGGGPVSAGDCSFFWGPAVSWNEDLECWVMVMARVDAGYWVGDSVWYSTNPHQDLGEGTNSQDWSAPRLLLRRPGRTLWYPSLQPLATPEDIAARRTSIRLGARARLWVKEIGPDFDGYVSEHEVTVERR